MKRVCGGSYQCGYDFIMTERRDVAVFTKFYQDDFVNTKSIGLQTSELAGRGDDVLLDVAEALALTRY